MKQILWFKRKFDFSFEQNIFPSIIERLKGTPILLKDKISKIPENKLKVNIEGSWSIIENIGHLIDLEDLWDERLAEILSNKKEMKAADLENKKTEQANHNNRNVQDLLLEFTEIRSATIYKLEKLTENDIYKFALHPRLKTPMRIMDLFLFAAEHDDHHLARISELDKRIF